MIDILMIDIYWCCFISFSFLLYGKSWLLGFSSKYILFWSCHSDNECTLLTRLRCQSEGFCILWRKTKTSDLLCVYLCVFDTFAVLMLLLFDVTWLQLGILIDISWNCDKWDEACKLIRQATLHASFSPTSYGEHTRSIWQPFKAAECSIFPCDISATGISTSCCDPSITPACTCRPGRWGRHCCCLVTTPQFLCDHIYRESWASCHTPILFCCRNKFIISNIKLFDWMRLLCLTSSHRASFFLCRLSGCGEATKPQSDYGDKLIKSQHCHRDLNINRKHLSVTIFLTQLLQMHEVRLACAVGYLQDLSRCNMALQTLLLFSNAVCVHVSAWQLN